MTLQNIEEQSLEEDYMLGLYYYYLCFSFLHGEDILKKAIYPGSFDPITKGHLSIIEQALNIFDFVHVIVGINPDKPGFIPHNARVILSEDSIKEYFEMDIIGHKVSVSLSERLVAKEAQHKSASHIVRGLRASSDFEYEFMMNGANSHICPDIETVFFMPPQEFMFVSSSTVREIVTRDKDEDLSWLVTPTIEKTIKAMR